MKIMKKNEKNINWDLKREKWNELFLLKELFGFYLLFKLEMYAILNLDTLFGCTMNFYFVLSFCIYSITVYESVLTFILNFNNIYIIHIAHFYFQFNALHVKNRIVYGSLRI